MKTAPIFAAAALALLLTAPAHAQAPTMNLMPEFQSKTPEEKEADELKQKAYRDSLRKIPDAKASNDPWGNVRSDAPKPAPAAKTTQTKTTRAKTGSTQN